jgi:HSP20 family protein
MQNVAFTRWDPFRDLLALHDQIGQLVGADAPGWNPPVDLYETAAGFVLTAEIPGLSRDHIDIHVEDARIVIRGDRSGSVPCEHYHRVERGHGRFQRAFALPEPVDTERVTADLKDGLLTITLPKTSGHAPRRVSVS